MNQDKLLIGKIIKGLIISVILMGITLGSTYYYYQHRQYAEVEGVIHGEEISYKAVTDGVVLNWLVEKGAKVDGNTPVVKINSEINEQQLAALQKSYDEAKALFQTMEKNIKAHAPSVQLPQEQNSVKADDSELKGKIALAQSRLQQMESLLKSGAVSQREYEKAKANLLALQQGLQSSSRTTTVANSNYQGPSDKQIMDFAQAQIRYSQLEKALEQVKSHHNEVEIPSPLAGTIVAENYDSKANFKTGDNLFTVDTGKNLALYIKIQGNLLNYVHSGQYVMYNIKGKQWDGLIQAIVDGADGAKWAKISLPEQLQVTTGEKVQVKIAIDS